jgi:hypothetical protein
VHGEHDFERYAKMEGLDAKFLKVLYDLLNKTLRINAKVKDLARRNKSRQRALRTFVEDI